MSGPVASADVVAVVVTHERRALLAQTLRAIQAQTHAPSRIVVVDNASTDGTADFVRAVFPDVALLALGENRGGAGGFAAGIADVLRRAPARPAPAWIWVMDDDVEPAPGALAALLATPEACAPGTAALASLKVTPTGEIQHEHAGQYHPARMWPEPLRPVGEMPVAVGYSSFVSLCVRADVARAVGLPRADFFIWYDDIEYSVRLREHGAIVLVPASRVVHHNVARARSDGSSPRESPDAAWRSYYALRNRLLILHTSAVSPSERRAGLVRGALYLLRRLAKVTLAEPHKRARLTLALRAFADGVRGVGGARVKPPAP